mgnify:FL=1
MLPLLEQSFDSASAARDQAESFGKGETGAIRVAFSHTVDLSLVSEALRKLEKVLSEVQLTCQRAPSGDLVERWPLFV